MRRATVIILLALVAGRDLTPLDLLAILMVVCLSERYSGDEGGFGTTWRTDRKKSAMSSS